MHARPHAHTHTLLLLQYTNHNIVFIYNLCFIVADQNDTPNKIKKTIHPSLPTPTPQKGEKTTKRKKQQKNAIVGNQHKFVYTVSHSNNHAWNVLTELISLVNGDLILQNVNRGGGKNQLIAGH